MKPIFSILVVLILNSVLAQDLYREIYRPQFHPSPSSGFMGDPNGPIKYNGTYRFYWWGHHSSDDLVHWNEVSKNALNGTPAGFGNWSGCVVVDLYNTSGLGTVENPPMVAVYTLNDNSNGIQHQAISVSLNEGSFNYFAGNPVIESDQPDFRDPQVFWHESTEKWVMVVTKPIERGIEIYSSPNLIDWTYESTFNGKGAKKQIWEVPDLFELPVNNSNSDKKWVMTCGMGPNRMQFWIGDFDGKSFTLSQDDNLMTGANIPGDIFENFELGFQGWTVEGDAFGNGPATGALPDQMEVNGFIGNGYANSFHQGDDATGKLTSGSFEITKRFINLLVGGGTGDDLSFNVLVEGEIIRSMVSASNVEELRWRAIDVSDYQGQMAHIEIVDEATGSWGHILVDHIVFSDIEYDTRIENANWADWGHDFYAGKTFRNYDFDDERTIWFAWMGNWTYARDVITVPWKGCESVPRTLALVNEGIGYELIQEPIIELEQLRVETQQLNDLNIDGVLDLTDFEPDWNVYELKVSFKVDNASQRFGINLAEGEDSKSIITYDAWTSVLSFNRTGTRFSYGFQRETKAPIQIASDSVLDLHIFVDRSSVEIFANDYKTSITSLAFTDIDNTGISLFSENGATTVEQIQIWDLNSIHGVTADQVEIKEEPLAVPIKESRIYPNPVEAGEFIHLSTRVDEACLVDITGKKIILMTTSTGNSWKIPRSVKPGIYALKYTNSHQRNAMRFIVK